MRFGIILLCLNLVYGDEWTYKEKRDPACNFIGCCGDYITNPCSPENWIYMNDDTFS